MTTPEQPLKFPHPAYATHILQPAFNEAKKLLFQPMLAANAAHLIMLAETGIIAATDAGKVLAAMERIAAKGADAYTYTPEIEDLFFIIEGELIADAGAEAGGNLQIARSRNDLSAVMSRLMLRERVLRISQQFFDLRACLLQFANEHIDTLMPGVTHTQPAQPTTLAHYLGGILGPLARDAERLRGLYERINRNPMGVAAFTTTGFPIDRALTTRLLGFNGIVENGYDAVGASDHMLETSGTLMTAASSISRLVYDLLVWARPEVGILRIGDEFVQISSIMPQKRNPVVLEHIRARIAYVYGDAATVATMIHSSAYGDTNDVEDQIFVPLVHSFAAMGSVLELLTAVMTTLGIDRQLLAARAGRGFTTSTELADTLVRTYGLPFRSAHSVASQVVKNAVAMQKEAPEITPQEVEDAANAVLGRPLGISAEALQAALDPRAFVAARAIPGGPARPAMQHALDEYARQLGADQEWLAHTQTAIATAERERQQMAAALMATIKTV